MKKFTSFLTKKAGFLSNTRKIQQEADALRVLILTEYFRRNLGVTKTTAVASHLSTTGTTDAANPATSSATLLRMARHCVRIGLSGAASAA